MKRAKRLSALVAVLVVVCAAAVAVTQMEERQEQIQATGEIVLELDSDAVTALSWTYEDTSLAFHKDGTWLYDDDARRGRGIVVDGYAGRVLDLAGRLPLGGILVRLGALLNEGVEVPCHRLNPSFQQSFIRCRKHFTENSI